MLLRLLREHPHHKAPPIQETEFGQYMAKKYDNVEEENMESGVLPMATYSTTKEAEMGKKTRQRR
jgi:hypothetical protein